MRTSIIVFKCFIKGLFNIYTIKLVQQQNDKPHGIVSENVGNIVYILFSLSVQLVNVILS